MEIEINFLRRIRAINLSLMRAARVARMLQYFQIFAYHPAPKISPKSEFFNTLG